MKKSFIFWLLAALVVSTTIFTGCEKKDKQTKEEVALEKEWKKELEVEEKIEKELKACQEQYKKSEWDFNPPECKELKEKQIEQMYKTIKAREQFRGY